MNRKLQQQVDGYFRGCKACGEPTDLADFARYMQIDLAELLPDWKGSQPTEIRRALTRLEADLNERALLGQCSPEQGMADLITYFGWRA